MKQMQNRDFVRFVVKSTTKCPTVSYSTQLGYDKAMNFAIACADHFSTRGEVYGETSDKNRVLLYDSLGLKPIPA